MDTQVYTAEEVQKALNLGRTKTYEFLNDAYKTQKPFRVIKVGTAIRVPKKAFDEWLMTVGA